MRVSFFDPRLILFLSLIVTGAACKKMENGGPAISAISPNSGLGGNLVTVTGSGFSSDATQDIVTVGGLPAEVVTASPTQLIIVVPYGVTTGAVVVSVNGRMAKGPVYTVSSISISAVSPMGGKGGTVVTITGMGFVNTGRLGSRADVPIVYFNGRPAVIDSANATTLIVTVPDSAGYGPITLLLDSVTVTGPVFNFFGLGSVSPLTGNVGTKITIKGGFGATPDKDTVTINGQMASLESAAPGQLVVAVPAGDTTGPIVIRVNGEVIQGPVFTFVPPPSVTRILPSSGPAGTRVVLTGSSFSSVINQDSVTINGIPASVVSASPTQLVIIAPAGTTGAPAITGPVAVYVNGQSVVGPVYTYQSLGITGITPMGAVPPCSVTISGFGFGVVAANDVVQLNGVAVTVVSVVDTQLVVNVPAGVTTGIVTVQVGGLSAMGPVFSTAGVITFAGGTSGLANGVGAAAQFISPTGLAIDASGNIFVADNGGNNIRKIALDGTVTNFAGDPNGGGGYSEGQGTSARFNTPNDLVFDKLGNLYVADQGNNVIRKITPDGTVSTFALIPGNDQPWGVTVDGSGNLYASDWSGNIDNDYEFDPTGTLINTLTMNVGARLTGIAVDAQGNVYTIDKRGNGIFKNASLFFSNTVLSSNDNRGLCLDNNGNLVIADGSDNMIELVNTQTQAFSVITGGGSGGNRGYQDGVLSVALFNYPQGVKVDAQGNIYVADQGNHAIRKISVK